MKRAFIGAFLFLLATFSMSFLHVATASTGAQYAVKSAKPSVDGKAVQARVVIKDHAGKVRTCTFFIPGSLGEENGQAFVMFSGGRANCSPEYK